MAQLMLVNPRKRRKATRKRRTISRRKSPAIATSRTVTTRKYRRNPIRKTDLVDTFTGGAVGAAGALAVDVAMQKLPIPTNLKVGAMGAITKGMVGIGLGMAIAKLGKNKKLGTQMADGAVTVALYSAGKSMIGPKLGLSASDLMGADDLLYYSDDGMSYFDDDDDGMGWTNPAQVFPSANDDDF